MRGIPDVPAANASVVESVPCKAHPGKPTTPVAAWDAARENGDSHQIWGEQAKGPRWLPLFGAYLVTVTIFFLGR
jgi:hypothetical protein